MKIVIDGLGAAPGTSAGVILQHLVEGWAELETDEVHLLVGPRMQGEKWPEEITVVVAEFAGQFGRVLAQTTAIPRVCRDVGADALVGLLPSTCVRPLRCPKVVLSFDLRHEQLPGQFTSRTRALRKVAYGIGFRQAAGIACISERTKKDLVERRRWLANRRVEVAPLGADHVGVAGAVAMDDYALAFGQFGHKNAEMVIEGWALLRDRGSAMPLRLIGMSDEARAIARAQIEQLDLEEWVTPMPWLSGEELQRCLAAARLFVFPSQFEGFGLPAVEAMQLGVPLVVTPEPALLEVTAGTVTVMRGWSATALADAVQVALQTTPEELERARRRAADFTWVGMASRVRAMIVGALAERS